MSDLEGLGRIAAKWAAARMEERRLRDARAACECERAQPGGYYIGADPDIPHPEIKACWKREEWESDYTPTEPARWCPPCLERQRLHVQVLAATRHRAALQSGLMRCYSKLTPLGLMR